MELGISAVLKAAGIEWLPRQRAANAAADAHRFTLYGGSRGPGKSFWLRSYLVRFHLYAASLGCPNIRTMLASEDYPSLYDRQIVKIVENFPPALGRYVAGDKKEFQFCDVIELQRDGETFRLPVGGAICLRNLDDPEKYQSAEFAAIAVEELTKQKRRRTLDILRSSLRWPSLPISPRFIAATNPTGPGVSWVRGLWIERDFPKEYGEIKDQFAFVPGLPQDNTHLTDDYWVMLRTLPPVLRKAWLNGDWYSGVEGAIYPDWSGAVNGNVTEQADYKPGWGPVEWWLDDGFSAEHPLYCGLVQVHTDGRMNVFAEYLESFKQHDQVIEDLADMGYPMPEIARIPSEAGRLAQVLHQVGIRTAMSTHRIEDGVPVMRANICDGHGNRRLLVHPRCRQTVQSISSLPEDPARPGRPLKVNGTPGDHPADACRYGVWWRRLQ